MEQIVERYYNREFLSAIGISRQRLYKMRQLKVKARLKQQGVLKEVKQVRSRHKNMSARMIHSMLESPEVGINKFERIASEHGLSVPRKKKRIVTTISDPSLWDRNLINGLEINDICQVIAGDITYYEDYYIFTLKDMYSKRIVGLYGSDNMRSFNAIQALKQVIRLRGATLATCIHHTDAGSQYKSEAYGKYLKRYRLQMSISNNCLENGMAEQLNGVLKNDYLPEGIPSVGQLNKELKRIKRLINYERPVKALGKRSPVEYEEYIAKLPSDKRTKIKLYDFTKD